MKKLVDTTWFLPALSALCFILAFYPFNFGLFALFALAPLRLCAARPNATDRRTFWGAFAAGAAFSLVLSYTTLIQFHWVREAYLFSYLVRASTAPIVLLSGCLCGLALLLGRRLYSWSPILQAAMGASIYTLAELLAAWAFKGYYFGTLAYALVDWPVFRALAFYGGATLATFTVAFVGFLLAEAVAVAPERRGRFALQVLAVAVVALSVAAVSRAAVLDFGNPAQETVNVALVQSGAKGESAFATRSASGELLNSGVEVLLRAAASAEPDLIVYPFSLVEAAVRRGEERVVFNRPTVSAEEAEIGAWAAAAVGPESALALWYTVAEGERFTNELVVWRGGEIESRYQKRHLYPFMDYTPAAAQAIGLFSTAVDGSPGPESQSFGVGELPLGGLVCSEVNDHELARRTAASGVAALLSVGSEAMFADDVAGLFNLASARFRAAENGLPVARSSKFGPSALIDARGEIVASMPFGASGFSVAPLEVSVAEGPRTVYARFGGAVSAALIAIVALCRLVEALICRGREPERVMYSRDPFREA